MVQEPGSLAHGRQRCSREPAPRLWCPAGVMVVVCLPTPKLGCLDGDAPLSRDLADVVPAGAATSQDLEAQDDVASCHEGQGGQAWPRACAGPPALRFGAGQGMLPTFWGGRKGVLPLHRSRSRS